ncbi:MAG: putative Na+/H+ antiporter [Desulfobacterales bacterium]|jgi:hypothetical protein
MSRKRKIGLIAVIGLAGLLIAAAVLATGEPSAGVSTFPKALDSYQDPGISNVFQTLTSRVKDKPFNLVATLIFFCAIVHTFLTSRFLRIAHKWEHRHQEKIWQGKAPKNSAHQGAELLHFLGEVEVVFGLWIIPLALAAIYFFDRSTWVGYLNLRVDYTEALFVVVVMILASTRPIIKLAEAILGKVAGLLGGSLKFWWLSILTIGPILGSFITEPAAMTIAALLLSDKLYDLGPSSRLKYATIGLLFVNVSVGGTLTHFAAPPVLMVAGPWEWGMGYMLAHFGWKAVVGILLANTLYFFLFRKELEQLQEKFHLKSLKEDIQKNYIRRDDLEVEFEKIASSVGGELDFRQTLEKNVDEIVERTRDVLKERCLSAPELKRFDRGLVKKAFNMRFEEIVLCEKRRLLPNLLPEEQRAPFLDPDWDKRDGPVPVWITIVHVIFLAWVVANAHYPKLFLPGLLFFLGFAKVTSFHQNRVELRTPILVGFFLFGLVTHGGLQGWWIEPVLGSLKEIPLMIGATILTAFNDNAAITYLSTLVPGFTDSMKYAVVSGAVAGGGLTIIANAPNPAGQAILKKFLENGLSPLELLKSALLPTLIVWFCFFIFS